MNTERQKKKAEGRGRMALMGMRSLLNMIEMLKKGAKRNVIVISGDRLDVTDKFTFQDVKHDFTTRRLANCHFERHKEH